MRFRRRGFVRRRYRRVGFGRRRRRFGGVQRVGFRM